MIVTSPGTFDLVVVREVAKRVDAREPRIRAVPEGPLVVEVEVAVPWLRRVVVTRLELVAVEVQVVREHPVRDRHVELAAHRRDVGVGQRHRRRVEPQQVGGQHGRRGAGDDRAQREARGREPDPRPTGHATRRDGSHRSRPASSPGIGASASVSSPVTNATTSRSSSWVPDGVLEAAQRLGHVERLAVWAGRRHRRERVGHREDPADQRDVVAGEAVEIAATVDPLVVVPDAGSHGVDVGDVADDHVAERDVLLHDLELLVGQLAGLAQHLVGDADLADVVEQARDPDRLELRGRDVDPPGEEQRVAGDVLGVALRVAVLGVDRADQALEDVERPGQDGGGLGRRPADRRRHRSPSPPGGSPRRSRGAR